LNDPNQIPLSSEIARGINQPSQTQTISDQVHDDFVKEFSQRRSIDSSDGMPGSDPNANNFGSFGDYPQKRGLNYNKVEQPYAPDPEQDVFTMNKQKFRQRSYDDTQDLFNIDNYLPNQIEDWWDVDPLLASKKIQGTHLINPAYYLGINTIGSSRGKGVSNHDLRAAPPNPRIPNISPWNNPTVEADTNIKGLGCPI
jgi:hypothetical protein